MRITSLILALALAGPAYADNQTATGTVKLSELPGGSAIGRVMMSDRAMCTGALVGANMVLTAAHCLYDPITGRRVKANDMRFEAGVEGGEAKVTRRVARAKHHPKYKHRKRANSQLGHDLAILRLDGDIPPNKAKPVPVGREPQRGEVLGVVSYTLGRQTDAALVYPCKVLARQSETLVMSCQVDFGASGAPILSLGKGKQPALVSVVSAKAAMGGREVSVGTTLDTSTLGALMAEDWANLD